MPRARTVRDYCGGGESAKRGSYEKREVRPARRKKDVVSQQLGVAG